ncbi:Rho GTPase-activating protein 28 [Acipenser ruthenus]|uniref:Rho GTPase-activating protein 28 n=1 Tax=Acipenser ruthenus TaxID=7906 RepID=A0A444UL78_ACIRT|nr:Rho GTPase-activating protein 28 [Acipenser ruthenus]
MDRMISQDSLHPPSFSRSVSQESLDSTSIDDYWSEVKSIEESAENGQDQHAALEVKSADEGELEEAWLQEAGLSTLMSGSPGEEPAEALFSTLTRMQAAVVKKRIDNYTQTQRKKKPVRDVRDIFAVEDSPHDISVSMLLGKPGRHWLMATIPAVLQLIQVESCASDCKLNKDSPSLPEELNLDVPYSECALRKDCRRNQRIKKDDATLPKFMIRKAKLGLTVVGDLSQEDMKKIGYISLIELTAYFEALGIELKRNRTVKNKVREYGLFGVPLTTLLENDQKKFPGSKVPLIFKKLLSKLEQTGLQTEGILRVPGSASRVKNLRQELEAKFYEDTFEWDQVRHNDAAGLLKMFIRELPYPLLTVEYLPAFIAVENRSANIVAALRAVTRLNCSAYLINKVFQNTIGRNADISPSKLQLQALHLLMMLLPEPNRDTLKVGGTCTLKR